MTLGDQILQRWGKYGDWQSADQNQAADLARLFEANGITDLSKLQINQRDFDVGPQYGVLTGFVGDQEQYGDIDAYQYKAPVFTYDGRDIGFLGDINRDGSVSRIGERSHLGFDGGPQYGVHRPEMAAWSSAGGGHTNFNIVPDGSGGWAIAPTWESSKADDLWGAKMAALFAAGAAGGAFGAGAGAGTTAGAAGTGAMTGAYTGVASSAFTGADPLKAGYGGLVTGAIGGGINGYGAEQGWNPATTRAVSGGANAALRGGSGEDILKGAVGGYLSSTGGQFANNYLPGGDMKLEAGFFDQGGPGAAGGGGMDFSGSFDPSLFDFGTGGTDGFNWGNFGGWSDNVFGDSFGNTPVNFGSSFDPSIYDFGQTFDGAVPNSSYPGGAGGQGVDLSKLGNSALKWLTTGSGADGKGVPPLAALLAGGLGYMDSKDKEQTQSREPWKAAQPFLNQLLGQGQQLSTQYQQQPFSQGQQSAYNNQAGLLNAINTQMPGLLGAFNANASGANQFVRGQPKQLQGGSFQAPQMGLLNYFGG